MGRCVTAGKLAQHDSRSCGQHSRWNCLVWLFCRTLSGCHIIRLQLSRPKWDVKGLSWL